MITGALPYSPGWCRTTKFGLLDENVEEISWTELGQFDIVGVTGMNVQKERMRQILEKLRAMKVFTVVGGAYASVDERYFDGLCDVLFSGEADETWPEFVRCFAEGETTRRSISKRIRRICAKSPSPASTCSRSTVMLRGAAILPRLPVSVRVLRHHRHLRPPSAHQTA